MNHMSFCLTGLKLIFTQCCILLYITVLLYFLCYITTHNEMIPTSDSKKFFFILRIASKSEKKSRDVTKICRTFDCASLTKN